MGELFGREYELLRTFQQISEGILMFYLSWQLNNNWKIMYFKEIYFPEYEYEALFYF